MTPIDSAYLCPKLFNVQIKIFIKANPEAWGRKQKQKS
jgi:hypothetical protein